MTLLIAACAQAPTTGIAPAPTSLSAPAQTARRPTRTTKPASVAELATSPELTESERRGLQLPDSSRAMARAFAVEGEDPGRLEAAVVAQDSRSGLEVRSPAPAGVAFSDPLRIDLRDGKYQDLSELTVRLDGEDVTDRFAKGAIKGHWQAAIPGLTAGTHTLTVATRATGAPVTHVDFHYRTGSPIDRIRALADASVRRFDVHHMKWDWHEGLLLYSLARLDAHLGEHRYEPYIRRYYRHWIDKGVPKINWSDRCVPALAAFELYRQSSDPAYLAIGQRVVDYLQDAKPTKAGGLNHMGTHPFSWIYPESMWVDSLMMYDVFAARWGRLMHDPAMTEFAAEQPLHFIRALQDPETKLWKHAYLTNFKRPIPKSDVYWLRGNGWAMAAIPQVLDELPAGHPKRGELTAAFKAQAEALVPYQDPGGLWFTVLNRPGKTYLETSGTALCAFGMMAGADRGYLPAEFRRHGEKAFLAVLDRLEQGADGKGTSMPEISHNTMPYSFTGYSLVPQKSDLGYGLGAMILAGIAYDGGAAR